VTPGASRGTSLLAGARVLVTGAGGQLGSAMADRLGRELPVVAVTHADLDIADQHAVELRVRQHGITVVINCAAYNQVDDAEDHGVEAMNVNAIGVMALARAARSAGAAFVHYGTDFVFDGNANRPYTEEDPPAPRSTYGLSKLLGEWLAAEAERSYVLRVESLFGGPRARSSIDRIITSLRRGEPARVFVDRTVTPSYVPDVVDATLALLRNAAPAGVYHCVNSGVTTWADVARETATLLGLAGDAGAIVPVKVSEVPMKAARPQYCALANDKLRAAGFDMPSWRDALARYIATSAA
jgi:dTDP-4-dehydrorhamnose reductase